jgi:hypothetical protein
MFFSFHVDFPKYSKFIFFFAYIGEFDVHLFQMQICGWNKEFHDRNEITWPSVIYRTRKVFPWPRRSSGG